MGYCRCSSACGDLTTATTTTARSRHCASPSHVVVLLALSSLILLSTHMGRADGLVTAARRHIPWLIVDFDGTCTEEDTTPLLPQLAASLSNHGDGVTERWRTFEDEYFRLYGAVKERVMSAAPDTMTLEEALSTMDDVSTLVTRQVGNDGVLAGLPTTTEGMASLLTDGVPLQAGCLDTLARAVTDGWEFRVLSINWSRALLGAALLQPLRRQILAADTLDDSIIWSNDLDEHGVITLTIPGALEKRARIRAVRADHDDALIVYVGDSTTDLLALLEADVGIVVGNSRSTVAMAERWGVRLEALSKWQDRDDNDPRPLWVADRWEEIDRLLSAVVGVDGDAAEL